MISNWLIGIFGNIGTAALLLVVAFAYFIWQFNPAFKTPVRNKVIVAGEADANDQTDKIAGTIAGKTINEKYAEGGIGNSLKATPR